MSESILWTTTDLELSDVTCNNRDVTVRKRVSEHRRRLRERGLRPVQIWVPDVRSEEFAIHARHQAELVARADRETDDQAFIDAVSVRWDNE